MEKKIVVIERGADGYYTALLNEENYMLLGNGNTAEEAIKDFHECYVGMKEEGAPVPELEFEFRYDMASFLHYYAGKLTLSGLQEITGVNRKQLSHYVTGHRRPSPATVKRIEEGIHKFTEELSHVSFI